MNMSNEYKDWLTEKREEYDAAIACFKKEGYDYCGFYSLQDEDAKYIIIIDSEYGDGIMYNREDGTYKRLVDCDRP